MLTRRFDFFVCDGVGHARITMNGQIRTHLLERFRRVVNAFPRKMRIGISRGAFTGPASACRQFQSSSHPDRVA